MINFLFGLAFGVLTCILLIEYLHYKYQTVEVEAICAVEVIDEGDGNFAIKMPENTDDTSRCRIIYKQEKK